MLAKIQVALCILAGAGIVIFIVAMITNVQVKQFEPVSGLLGILAWGSFGMVFASCVGVVATQVLEFREPKEPKAVKVESVHETEAPVGELAPIVATADEAAGVEAATADFETPNEFEASTDFEPAQEGLLTELDAGEGLGESLPELGELDFTDFTEE